jgi:hypothetical protein
MKKKKRKYLCFVLELALLLLATLTQIVEQIKELLN